MTGECEDCGNHCTECICDKYMCPDPISSYSVKIVKNKTTKRKFMDIFPYIFLGAVFVLIIALTYILAKIFS